MMVHSGGSIWIILISVGVSSDVEVSLEASSRRVLLAETRTTTGVEKGSSCTFSDLVWPTRDSMTIPERCTQLFIDVAGVTSLEGHINLNYLQVGSLALALEMHTGELLSFDMRHQRVDEPEMRTYAAFLSRDPPLLNFTMRSAHIDAAGAKLLSDALRSNTHLEVVDLAQNSIRDGGAAALGDALGAAAGLGSAVHTLRLEVNEIGASGVAALCEGLIRAGDRTDGAGRGAGLRRLHLSQNYFGGGVGATALAQLLVSSSHGAGPAPPLEVLSIAAVRLGDAGAMTVAAAMQRNAHLVALQLYDNKTH